MQGAVTTEQAPPPQGQWESGGNLDCIETGIFSSLRISIVSVCHFTKMMIINVFFLPQSFTFYIRGFLDFVLMSFSLSP